MKRMACAVALAAGSGLTGVAALPALGDPSPVTAASGLQITVLPPGTLPGDAAIPLDVRFRGGNIRVIELFVDGVRLTRQAISTRDGRGVVHFSLDPSLLTEGSHELLIKAYEADGTCATTTTQISIAAADASALARFEWPKRNAEVQGIVPIKIKLDPSIVDPYVTYTVDSDFLAFRNYAPYTYNWDTAKAANGIHTIGIEVMDGRTLQVVQKMTLSVNVKNIGGFTKVPPPSSDVPKAETGNVAEAIQGVAESALPAADLTGREAGAAMRGSVHTPQAFGHRGAPLSAFRSNSPLRTGSPLDGATLNRTRVPSSSPANSISSLLGTLPLKGAMNTLRTSMSAIAMPTATRPAANPGAIHIAPGLGALSTNPAELMPPTGTSLRIFGITRQPVHFRRMGGIALRPGVDRRPVRQGTAPFRPAAPSLQAFVGTGHATVRPFRANPSKRYTFRSVRGKTFDVAFNNTLISFDVAPRVEHGLPLAPFRTIFEHNGGTVKWYSKAKLLRAYDSAHEIEIKVGSRAAKVNNQPVSMEATPYIDHGRTIVPLSFVRDAMDLKVTFDKQTGHLMIEKK